MNRKRMHRTVAALLTVLLLLGLAACGKVKDAPTTNAPEQESAPQNQSSTPETKPEAQDKKVPIFWLEQADFSQQPKTELNSTLTAYHVPTPLTPEALDEQAAPYSVSVYVNYERVTTVYNSIEELYAAKVPIPVTSASSSGIGNAYKIWGREGKERETGVVDAYEVFNLTDSEQTTIDECLDKGWWRVSGESNMGAFLDLENYDREINSGGFAHADFLDHCIAKLGTPHRLDYLGSADEMRKILDGSYERNDEKGFYFKMYDLVWIFSDCVITIDGIGDSGYESTRASESDEDWRISYSGVTYYDRRLWDELESLGSYAMGRDYLEPYAESSK